MNIADLVALRDNIAKVLKDKRANAKSDAKVGKAEREVKNRAELSEGDKVTFLYNKAEMIGKIKRRSDKSVTVEFELDGETVKRYRDYGDVLNVIEKAAKVEGKADEAKADEAEVDEAVA